MKKNTEIVTLHHNDAPLQVEVTYEWETGEDANFKFASVAIQVLDREIDILPLLHRDELDYIQEQLNYE